MKKILGLVLVSCLVVPVALMLSACTTSGANATVELPTGDLNVVVTVPQDPVHPLVGNWQQDIDPANLFENTWSDDLLALVRVIYSFNADGSMIAMNLNPDGNCYLSTLNWTAAGDLLIMTDSSSPVDEENTGLIFTINGNKLTLTYITDDGTPTVASLTFTRVA